MRGGRAANTSMRPVEVKAPPPRDVDLLAELGVADHVVESISGHLSRRMPDHCSQIEWRRR